MTEPSSSAADWKPRPDPTALTTEALEREVANFRRELDGQRKLIEEKIAREKDTVAERFDSLDRQLDLIERARVEQKADANAALTAALAAAKEAVGKAEDATTKSIDQLGETFKVEVAANRRDIDDTKARLGAIEGAGSGSRRAEDSKGASNALNVSIVSVVISGLALIVVSVIAIFGGG